MPYTRVSPTEFLRRQAPQKLLIRFDDEPEGHLHVAVDGAPWVWAETSGGPLIIAGLPAGPHKVEITLVNANHQPLDRSVVAEFVIPGGKAAESGPLPGGRPGGQQGDRNSPRARLDSEELLQRSSHQPRRPIMFKTSSFPTPRSVLATSVAAGAAIAVVLAVLGGRAISAQDKYTVQVPNGLAFSEFRGFEDWPTVAVSQTGDLIEVILANPMMIDAYRAGVRQRQAFPRRLQDGKDPLEREKECGGPQSDDCAGHPA